MANPIETVIGEGGTNAQFGHHDHPQGHFIDDEGGDEVGGILWLIDAIRYGCRIDTRGEGSPGEAMRYGHQPCQLWLIDGEVWGEGSSGVDGWGRRFVGERRDWGC